MKLKGKTENILTKTDVTATFTSSNLEVVGAKRFAISGVWTADTNAAITVADSDINTTTNVITKTNHGLKTGVKGVWTSSTTLPPAIDALPLDTSWIIKVTDNTFKIAASLADALAGTAVAIADDGTGNHTFTPTTVSATILPEATFDNPNDTSITARWFSIASSESITATGTKLWEFVDKAYHSVRLSGTIAAGSLVWDVDARVEE